MRKRPFRRRLTRPADAFLPAALLLASLFGHGIPAIYLFACLLGARLLALSTAGSLRAAFAMQPAMRDVQGSVKCALLMQPVGALLLAVLLRFVSAEWLRPDGLAFIGAGLLLNFEHVFYEYLYSAGDGGSALMSRLITAALVFAGLFLSETMTASLPIAAGAAMLASCAVALVTGGGLRGRMNACPLRAAPAFMLQDILYPAAFAGLMFALPGFLPVCHPSFDGISLAPWDAAFFSGLTLYTLCRTAFRRSPSESRPLNLALLVVSVIDVLLGAAAALILRAAIPLSDALDRIVRAVPTLSAALLLATLCALSLFGNFKKEA